VVDDVSVFSPTSIDDEETRDMYVASEHCPGNVTQNNNTTNTPTNAYSSLNLAPQLHQNRAGLRTAQNNPFNAVNYPKATPFITLKITIAASPWSKINCCCFWCSSSYLLLALTNIYQY